MIHLYDTEKQVSQVTGVGIQVVIFHLNLRCCQIPAFSDFSQLAFLFARNHSYIRTLLQSKKLIVKNIKKIQFILITYVENNERTRKVLIAT